MVEWHNLKKNTKMGRKKNRYNWHTSRLQKLFADNMKAKWVSCWRSWTCHRDSVSDFQYCMVCINSNGKKHVRFGRVHLRPKATETRAVVVYLLNYFRPLIHIFCVNKYAMSISILIEKEWSVLRNSEKWRNTEHQNDGRKNYHRWLIGSTSRERTLKLKSARIQLRGWCKQTSQWESGPSPV